MRTVLVGLLVVLLGVLAPQHSAAAAYGSEAHTKKAETKVEVAPRGLLEKIPNPLGDSYELSDFFNGRLGLDTDTIWKKTLGLGGQVQSHAQRIAGHAQDFASQSLDDLKNQFKGATAQISEFQHTLNEAVSAANTFRRDIVLYTAKDATEEDKDKALTRVDVEFGRVLEKVMEEMRAKFSDSEDAPDHSKCNAMVDYVLGMVSEAMKGVFRGLCAKEEEAEKLAESFDQFVLGPVRKLLHIACDLAEKHPQLFMALFVWAVSFLFPQVWILRQLLGIFGFSAQGPVKGSTAAWAQRVFFGAIIPKGSWFSVLQKFGMS